MEFVQLSVSALVSSPLPSWPRVLCRSCLTSKYRNGCPSHPKVPGPYRRPGGWGRCGGQGSCEALSLYASISQALWSGVGGGGWGASHPCRCAQHPRWPSRSGTAPGHQNTSPGALFSVLSLGTLGPRAWLQPSLRDGICPLRSHPLVTPAPPALLHKGSHPLSSLKLVKPLGTEGLIHSPGE